MPKGFHFRFITLAGFHANNFSMFDLAQKYRERGMVIQIYIEIENIAENSRLPIRSFKRKSSRAKSNFPIITFKFINVLGAAIRQLNIKYIVSSSNVKHMTQDPECNDLA